MTREVRDRYHYIPVFWEIGKIGYNKLQTEPWFHDRELKNCEVPHNWICFGLDIVNGDAGSEIWDPFEDFWLVNPTLKRLINTIGLFDSLEMVEKVLPELPLDPTRDWAAPVRAWGPLVGAGLR